MSWPRWRLRRRGSVGRRAGRPGQIGDRGTLAGLAVPRMQALPIGLLQPLQEEPVDDRAQGHRPLFGILDRKGALRDALDDDLRVQGVDDAMERGAELSEVVDPGRMSGKIEIKEVEP